MTTCEDKEIEHEIDPKQKAETSGNQGVVGLTTNDHDVVRHDIKLRNTMLGPLV